MKPRGRPKKIRLVKGKPKIVQFSPRGRPGRPDEVELTIDEYEAIRLADSIGMGQNEASRHMGVSRQTFGRILKDARRRLAHGLVNGKIIRFHGGNIKHG